MIHRSSSFIIVMAAGFATLPLFAAAAPAASLRETVSGAMSVRHEEVYSGTICGTLDKSNPRSNINPAVCRGGSGVPRISGVDQSVSYHARLTDAATGLPVACGSTVHAGTQLRLEFVDHSPLDIYWFATGNYADSPNGYWVADANAPAGGICSPGNLMRRTGDAGNMYAALSIAPPAKTFSGTEQLGCSSAGASSLVCTTPTNGTFTPSFRFAPTYGHFYFDMSGWGPAPRCSAWSSQRIEGTVSPFGIRSNTIDHEYFFRVPEKTISCAITVIGGNDPGTTPTTPSTPTGGPGTPTVSSTGASSCTVGTPYGITMSATSPDSHPLRYLIDWDADGTTDELVPPSGYVPSGTVRTSSRTYASAGQKSIRVAAQDDEGRLSSWKTFSFDCASVPVGDDGRPDGTVGTVGTVGTGDASDLSLRALPSLVKKGATTRLSWSASNVSSCTVAGTNGDSWTGIASPVGGQLSGTITRQTTYTLSCESASGTLTKRAIVNVLPTWVEN